MFDPSLRPKWRETAQNQSPMLAKTINKALEKNKNLTFYFRTSTKAVPNAYGLENINDLLLESNKIITNSVKKEILKNQSRFKILDAYKWNITLADSVHWDHDSIIAGIKIWLNDFCSRK